VNITNASHPVLSSKDQADLDKAAGRIAPTWPLDRAIAVNPLWQMRELHIEDVAAKLAALAQINHLMPLDYYLGLFEQKKISLASLQKAAQQRGLDLEPDSLVEYLSAPSPVLASFQSLASLLDSQRSKTLMSWQDEVLFQVSQFCSSFFQKKRTSSTPQSVSLYQEWLRIVRLDRGLEVLMGVPHLRNSFKTLPDDIDSLFALSLSELKLEGSTTESYAHALLLGINGWASWVAYLDFHSTDRSQNLKNIREILGIRMAWELVIWRLFKDHLQWSLEPLWQQQKRLLPRLVENWKKSQVRLWVWSSALEIEYQTQLHEALSSQRPANQQNAYLQAVFCIDVRSEPIRRALESHDASIQTLGFAGFFGLPLSFEPSGTQVSRPQVPGLLKPSLSAIERHPDSKARRSARFKVSWDRWGRAAPSTFFMVEATGGLYLGKLLGRTFFGSSNSHPIDRLSHRKEWVLRRDDVELTAEEKAKIAGSILRASGLETTAPWVLLIGHGSQSCNNPQAATLDCGACGGQTGEVNVRVLTDLLNDSKVRENLEKQGLAINPSTRFLAALHNTTTDEIYLFDQEIDPRIDTWLKGASALARKERIFSSRSENTYSSRRAAQAMQRRATDWSEVRPEWGLANNAAFIVAPRSWTRSLNLAGRCFLHDYDKLKDLDFSLLEMILTAPMIVTHWINMQYNCSVTDNQRYGSGNKVLHNVVGGTLGVFEGHGGDLRIGLAMQSLHDGETWRHTPQRLSVYVAAPKEAIIKIVSKHEAIRELVRNEWLYLFHWDETAIVRIEPDTIADEAGS
jgi:uncharacterized protein YbcC (UPF0753/DUF2309 family)